MVLDLATGGEAEEEKWVFSCFIFHSSFLLTLFLFVTCCIQVRESLCVSLFCLITHRLHSCDGCMLTLPYVNHFPPSQKPGLISAAFMTQLYLNATDFSIPVLDPNTHWQTKNSNFFCKTVARNSLNVYHIFYYLNIFNTKNTK